MRKSIHGLPFLSYMGMVLRLVALRTAPPELRYSMHNMFVITMRQQSILKGVALEFCCKYILITRVQSLVDVL